MQGRFNYHLAGELHARRAKIKSIDGRLGKAAQPAMKVAARTLKKHSANARKHRVAEISVQRRHGPRLNSTEKSISHDQVAPVAQLLEKARNLPTDASVKGNNEVVTINQPSVRTDYKSCWFYV